LRVRNLITSSAIAPGIKDEVTMRAVPVLVFGVVFALSGCNKSQPAGEQTPFAGRIGQNCTVQFRRGDGLGAGGSAPVPPTANAMNGAEVSVSGKLQAVAGSWIVVATDEREYCIPRESILLVQFNKAMK
jgi:hypothetical protein